MDRACGTDPQQVAWQAFVRELPALYEKYPEQWAAYLGDQRIGVGKSGYLLHQQCLAEGHRKGEFFVFGIAPLEIEIHTHPYLGEIPITAESDEGRR